MIGAAFPDATIGKLPEEAEKLMQGACPIAARAMDAREGTTRSEAPKRMMGIVNSKSVWRKVEGYQRGGDEEDGGREVGRALELFS